MTALFDIVYHMRASRDRLSATEQKVADAILEDIAFAAAASIDQLAVKAAVSIATISRFAKAVGCEDIRDLKLKLAQASAVGTRFLAEVPAVEESAFYTQ
ncbi:MAG TPA: MurR/RpiR family transcriptional regulator, partial [Cellvibrio sp.]|nr:MurR/RpiR family transcriptional regulator [Cellvibrio sp.]